MKAFTFTNQRFAEFTATSEELAYFVTCAPYDVLKRAYAVMTLTNWRGLYVIPQDPQEALSCALAPRLNIAAIASWAHLDYQEVCQRLNAALVPFHNGMLVTCLDDVLRLAPVGAKPNIMQDLKWAFYQLEVMLRDISVIVKEWLEPGCFEQSAKAFIAENQALDAQVKQEANERITGMFNDITGNSYTAMVNDHAKQAAQRMLDTRSKNCQKRLRRLARLAKQQEK